MNNDKSPGSDGFTTNIFKTSRVMEAWSKMSPDFTTRSSTLTSNAEAVIKLLQLQTDRLTITQAECGALLQDAQTALEQSQQIAVEAGKNISQELTRAIIQITDALTNNLLTIDERTQRGIARIASAEHDAINRIAKVSVSSENENFESQIKEFRQQLIKHYETKIICVPLSPLVSRNDRNIRDFYIPPKVIGVSKDDIKVDSYRDIPQGCTSSTLDGEHSRSVYYINNYTALENDR
ncbi:hypothetical protein DPMN_164268 [Dreissena polymorpha]|uniref:Uncharacterized protein n=1 Tax=Dreissena polymorpha TaxID=45954 RepID=A0A9D4EY84_DREPO|nr:hypothetical protein DPMN_164268 [Dreissena polymorpha]